MSSNGQAQTFFISGYGRTRGHATCSLWPDGRTGDRAGGDSPNGPSRRLSSFAGNGKRPRGGPDEDSYWGRHIKGPLGSYDDGKPPRRLPSASSPQSGCSIAGASSGSTAAPGFFVGATSRSLQADRTGAAWAGLRRGDDGGVHPALRRLARCPRWSPSRGSRCGAPALDVLRERRVGVRQQSGWQPH